MRDTFRMAFGMLGVAAAMVLAPVVLFAVLSGTLPLGWLLWFVVAAVVAFAR